LDSEFIVGIDLGTTNSALASCENASGLEGALIAVDAIPQIVNLNEVAERTLLPSFLYIPGELDFPNGSLSLPWDATPEFVVGELARSSPVNSQSTDLPNSRLRAARSVQVCSSFEWLS
jgi:molecular chaperone DnaK (HSP70)